LVAHCRRGGAADLGHEGVLVAAGELRLEGLDGREVERARAAGEEGVACGVDRDPVGLVLLAAAQVAWSRPGRCPPA
jgi:hypothetical protein